MTWEQVGLGSLEAFLWDREVARAFLAPEAWTWGVRADVTAKGAATVEIRTRVSSGWQGFWGLGSVPESMQRAKTKKMASMPVRRQRSMIKEEKEERITRIKVLQTRKGEGGSTSNSSCNTYLVTRSVGRRRGL